MPKSKKARIQRPSSGHVMQPKSGRKMHTFARVSTTTNPSTKPGRKNDSGGQENKKNPQQSHHRPIVPFGKKDRILLVGEGDFSFARSLVTQYHCRDVLATCYDSKEVLYGKYPRAEENVQDILHAFSKTKRDDRSDEPGEDDNQQPENDAQKQQHRRGPNAVFSVDARKLGTATGGGRDVRMGFPRKERKLPAWLEAKQRASSSHSGGHCSKDKTDGPWDLICFNFPHVGGISTDVNRQVRANQELLVAFFKACVPLLSPRPEVRSEEQDEEWDFGSETEDASGDEDTNGAQRPVDIKDSTARTEDQRRMDPGQILVTTFEGEPYTLWNIKDLARHAGLRVVTSFRFPWPSYQGYSHARTLGEVEGKQGGRGGWRGEDREARMYVFEVKSDDRVISGGASRLPRADTGARNKRLRRDDVSDYSE